MHTTLPLLKQTDFPAIARKSLTTLQINLGYRCNQSCLHCHVNAGPNRSEEMSAETIGLILDYCRTNAIHTLDLTGGAPELNPGFRYLVTTVRELGMHVIDRCNLTILNEPGQQDLHVFLAAHRLEVIASLPCYLQENVDAQRGKGVYESSLAAIKKLNAAGYGNDGSGLKLNFVFNPAGTSLPPSQSTLEADYRRELGKLGIVFNQLFTLTNMPIKRFGSTLISKGVFNDYMALLKSAHIDSNLDEVMCRSLISIDWQGYLYDCDFNQMLDLPLPMAGNSRPHLRDLMQHDLSGNPVAIADHCYGCTAGQGSSCGGALS
ncbi:MAG: arsenosugar biosynthesis radical SAM protein ArsS [Gammaproteobacteria bacterium]|nr:arsenosugar biosynthesis radical SAM protein ArsS [Gammaproteobacteria bacterium]